MPTMAIFVFMTDAKLSQLAQWLTKSLQVVIIPHKNPDGDAMGSCLAWQKILCQLGHHASVITPNSYPTFLHWLPGHDEVINYEKEQENAESLIANADIIFTLDFNTLKRIDEMGVRVASSSAKKIMIDHHQEPDDYADLMFSEPSMGSTCELVYHIIMGLQKQQYIDSDVATCLYTGILTDTGSFRFPSVTPTTHRAVADLIERGANHSNIHDNIKDSARPDRLKLLGTALSNMKFLDDCNTAYITLSQEELDRCNYQKGDTEGFVNYCLSISGIQFAVIMTEHKKENIIKMSFRSKGDFAANVFAKTYFEGGGHTNAAGGKSDRTLIETEKHFKAALKTFLN